MYWLIHNGKKFRPFFSQPVRFFVIIITNKKIQLHIVLNQHTYTYTKVFADSRQRKLQPHETIMLKPSQCYWIWIHKSKRTEVSLLAELEMVSQTEWNHREGINSFNKRGATRRNDDGTPLGVLPSTVGLRCLP